MEVLELIGTEVCPFAHRSVILMNEKAVPFKQTFIDSTNKPQWFLDANPTGKVPILRHGDVILFETDSINEYLDEVFSPRLHPDDPVVKSHNRGWIQYASLIFIESYKHLTARDEMGSKKAQQEILSRLVYLEGRMGEAPYFNGDHFSMVDVAFAPFFTRATMLSSPACGIDLLGRTPGVKRWAQTLLQRQSVIDSLPDNYVDLAANRYAERGGWLAGRYLASQG